MVGQENSETRITLLGRLRHDPNNQAVWAEFVEHYGGRIYGWCLKWNLQEADVQDVTQNVLLKLAEKLRDSNTILLAVSARGLRLSLVTPFAITSKIAGNRDWAAAIVKSTT